MTVRTLASAIGTQRGGVTCSAPTVSGRGPDADPFAVQGSLPASQHWRSSPLPARPAGRSLNRHRPRPRLSRPTASASVAAASPSASAVAAGPTCGTDPVVLNAYFETGFDIPFKLSEEFTKQYPNVTWNISQDQFSNLMASTPRLLAGDNPPDLIRLPTMVSLVKDDLLKNLDEYVTAFGWDKWPGAQLAQNRVAADGTRGSGSLYAAGLNYSLTGVFYNKKLATQIGMTEPPKTVAEFDDLLAKAKAAKLQPIMAWNASASGGGLAFPLQQLMAAYGPTQPINDWIFQKPGATIDTPTNLTAAQHLEQWITAGYFPKDANAIEYTDANARFAQGRGRVHVQRRLAGRRVRQGRTGQHRVLHLPVGHRRRARRRHVGAADLRHRGEGQARRLRRILPQLGRDECAARQVDVNVGGSNPGGPTDLADPAGRAGSIINDTLAAGGDVAKANGAMDFIANATGTIFPKGWTPELQKMVGGKQTARRPAQGRPGRVREGTRAVTHAAD